MSFELLPLEILISVIDQSSSVNLHVSKAVSARVCSALKLKYNNIANYTKLITGLLSARRLPAISLKYKPQAPPYAILKNIISYPHTTYDSVEYTRLWVAFFIAEIPQNKRLELVCKSAKKGYLTANIICLLTSKQLESVPWLLKRVNSSYTAALLNHRHWTPEQNAILITRMLINEYALGKPIALPHVCCVNTLHRTLLANGAKKFIPLLKSVSNRHLSGDCARRVIADDLNVLRGEVVDCKAVAEASLGKADDGWAGCTPL